MTTFDLSFDYEIKYQKTDLLYFGINFFLGFREFPIRVQGVRDSGIHFGADLSPISTTFTFNSPNEKLSLNDKSFFHTDGLDKLTLSMFYLDSSNRNQWTFKMGSVAIKLMAEFNSAGSGASIDNFFSADQYVEISNVKAAFMINTVTTQLVSQQDKVLLGKQYGEILLLSYLNSN